MHQSEQVNKKGIKTCRYEKRGQKFSFSVPWRRHDIFDIVSTGNRIVHQNVINFYYRLEKLMYTYTLVGVSEK